MGIASGSRLGRYDVAALIGAGGMGEVEALCGREASLFEAGSPQPKSRAQRGISDNPTRIVILSGAQRSRRISLDA
jgi:hypothetical protein